MLRRLAACFATVLVLAGMLTLLNLAEPYLDDVQTKPTPQRIETYRVTPQRALKVHVYEPPSQSGDPARPAIVFFYGGGWHGGDIAQFRDQSAALADLGIIAICAEYRVKQVDNTTPFDALSDALHAVAWVRANAEELGIDPHRLAVGGGSAGAHLAAACATVPDDQLANVAHDLPASPRPDALVLFNPVIDNGPTDTGYGHERIGDAYTWFSPAHNVRPGLPPTLIMLGTNDHLVPVSVAHDFRGAMHTHGNLCEIELYEGQPHGFFNNQPGKEPMFQVTLQRTIDFLRKHGWIEAEN
ncbi:MAG: alpha/beta hydrolase [Planctomycetota bacterium]